MGIRFRTTLAATILAAAAAPAMAGFTQFNNGPETSIYSIVTSNYGLPSITNVAFNSGATQSFTAGVYSFVRLHDDTHATPTDLHTAYTNTTLTTDARFADGSASVQFLVKHAGNTNRLGYSTATGAVNTPNYVDIIGSSGSATTTLTSNFQLALNVNGANSQYWGSDNAHNPGARDHFVTWYVEGNGRKFWFLAVEDLDLGDADYNDWVGELTVIPLPPAAWAGLSTLAGVGLIGFVRRRKNAAQ